MKQLMSKIAKKLTFVRYLFPSKLPIGVIEWEKFCTSIFKAYDLPDLPSYRNAIATMIMHIPPTIFYKPKHFFGVAVKKAMSNQTAYEIIQQIREAETLKEEEAKKALEAIVVEPIQDAAPSAAISI